MRYRFRPFERTCSDKRTLPYFGQKCSFSELHEEIFIFKIGLKTTKLLLFMFFSKMLHWKYYIFT